MDDDRIHVLATCFYLCAAAFAKGKRFVRARGPNAVTVYVCIGVAIGWMIWS